MHNIEKRSYRRERIFRFVRFVFILAFLLSGARAWADASWHVLAAGPLQQDWSNTGLIAANDNWAGVPSMVGYRGDDLTRTAGADPRTILADGSATPVDVNVNQSTPSTFGTGGLAEFDGIADPAVALQGSGTASAPFLLLHLCSTGMTHVRIAYDLRDLDGSTDNAVQPVALQYRIGMSGNFVNVPAAFVADATTGPGLATNVTHVEVVLPPETDNQPQLQARIITANAVGNDEWVGVDNIVASASPLTAAAAPAVKEDGGFSISCPTSVGWTYQLQRSADLKTWQVASSSFPGDGTTHRFDDSPAGDSAFWRIEVSGGGEVKSVQRKRASVLRAL